VRDLYRHDSPRVSAASTDRPTGPASQARPFV
jgi:hypothetical protein